MRTAMTALGLLLVFAPLPATAQEPRAKPDAEVMNYRLSMDKLRKLVELQRAFNAARAKNPQLFEKIDQESQTKEAKDGAPLTVAQKAAILEQYPKVRRAFSSAGGTARDWLLTFEAMGSAFVAVEAKKGTVTGPRPRLRRRRRMWFCWRRTMRSSARS